MASAVSFRLALAGAVMTSIRCHQSDSVTGPWSSLQGAYRADYDRPCEVSGTVDVMVTQTGSHVSAVIPGFGHLDCTAAPAGSLPRVTSATVTLDEGCGGGTQSYDYLPTDDSRVLHWFFPDGRGEGCNCGPGTVSVELTLTPE
jgi:hypothetical protein